MTKKISVEFKAENVESSFSVTAKNNGKHTIFSGLSFQGFDNSFTTSELRKLASFLLDTADKIEADTDLTPSGQ